MDTTRLQRLGGWMEELVASEQIPFGHVLVARHGVVCYEYATKNIAPRYNNSKSTPLWRLYSMTKPIVSVALMILYEEGRFQLTDPVHKYLGPSWDRKNMKGVLAADGKTLVPIERQITVQHILTHQAGLTYGFDPTGTINVLDGMYHRQGIGSGGNRGKDKDDILLADFVERLSKLPLMHQPGANWHYSLATDVVGRLVEVIGGMPLDEFLHRRIFAPLGMTDTGFVIDAANLPRLLPNYKPTSAPGLFVAPPKQEGAPPVAPGLEDISAVTSTQYVRKTTGSTAHYLSGGGGLAGTMADYRLFCEMLLGRGRAKLLSPRTIAFMGSNQLPDNKDMRSMLVPGNVQYSEIGEKGVGFGLGFSTVITPTTLASKGTIAWGGAASTIFWVDQDLDIAVIFLTQLMAADRTALPLRSILTNIVYSALIEKARL